MFFKRKRKASNSSKNPSHSFVSFKYIDKSKSIKNGETLQMDKTIEIELDEKAADYVQQELSTDNNVDFNQKLAKLLNLPVAEIIQKLSSVGN